MIKVIIKKIAEWVKDTSNNLEIDKMRYLLLEKYCAQIALLVT